MVTHLKGIKLVKGNNSFECPTCHSKFDNDFKPL
jgi:transposase-like protein